MSTNESDIESSHVITRDSLQNRLNGIRRVDEHVVLIEPDGSITARLLASGHLDSISDQLPNGIGLVEAEDTPTDRPGSLRTCRVVFDG